MRIPTVAAVLACLLLPCSLTAQPPSPAATQPPSPLAAQPPPPTPVADKDLESELAKELGAAEAAPAATPAPAPASGGGGTLRLIDISFDALFAAGGSSASPEEILVLQGGGHDPKQNGFTIQNVELTLLGAVDPYLRGQSHIVLQIDEAGETVVELEEAYLTTQTLPHGLQVKAGQFFTEVGRLNLQHPHSWGFVDQPVINSRIFGGDGLRGPGARISWLTPLPWYSELLLTVQNAGGETAFSFLSTKEEGEFAGFPFVDRPVDGLEDLLYTLRTLNSFTLSDTATLNLGASGVFGPNATGESARTTIVGLDAYLHWKRLASYQGFPFLSWQTELFHRNYEAGPAEDPETGEPVTDELSDTGLYSQVLWGFRHRWVAGARIDLAGGDGAAADPLRDDRLRLSADLTFFPSEFSKFRAQYNLDDAQHAEGLEHSVWLQVELLLGAHGAHKF